MGGRIRAHCSGEEAEKTEKGQRQGENLALCMRSASEIATTVLGSNALLFCHVQLLALYCEQSWVWMGLDVLRHESASS